MDLPARATCTGALPLALPVTCALLAVGCWDWSRPSELISGTTDGPRVCSPSCNAESTEPICDNNGRQCRACRGPSECPAGLCAADGSCPKESEIAHVSTECSGTPDGSRKSPWCTIPAALGTRTLYVLVAPGVYKDAVVLTGAREVHGDPGAKLEMASCGTVQIRGGLATNAVLSGFDIEGNLEIEDLGTQATVLSNIIGPSAESDDCVGVSAARGTRATLRRNLIRGHAKGGIALDGAFHVTNNFIVENGGSETRFGGARLKIDDGAEGEFRNNTVAGNTAEGRNDDEAGGVRCEDPVDLVSNIFWGNTFNHTEDAALARQYSAKCVASYSLEELRPNSTPTGTNLTDTSPHFAKTGAATEAAYYHITEASKARDNGDPKATPRLDRDYDGDLRDDKPDIGADEYVPR